MADGGIGRRTRPGALTEQ